MSAMPIPPIIPPVHSPRERGLRRDRCRKRPRQAHPNRPTSDDGHLRKTAAVVVHDKRPRRRVGLEKRYSRGGRLRALALPLHSMQAAGAEPTAAIVLTPWDGQADESELSGSRHPFTGRPASAQPASWTYSAGSHVAARLHFAVRPEQPHRALLARGSRIARRGDAHADKQRPRASTGRGPGATIRTFGGRGHGILMDRWIRACSRPIIVGSLRRRRARIDPSL